VTSNQFLFAFPGLVIATLFVTLPFTLREVAYVLEEIGTSEEEAAATLGAGPWQIFFRVTLPNIRFALGYGVVVDVWLVRASVDVVAGVHSGMLPPNPTFSVVLAARSVAVPERLSDRGPYGMCSASAGTTTHGCFLDS